MAIIVLTGTGKEALSLLANSMRNTAISQGKGALLIDDHNDGDAVHHLEKIISADKFIPGTEADKVNWKNDPQVVLVNSGEARLSEFEEMCPGFTAKFGPVKTMSVA